MGSGAGIALAAAVIVLTITAPCATAQAASVSGPGLSTDASGPLVPAIALAPGLLPPACVVVSWADLTGQELGFDAAVTGELADYVDVTIATGTGGRYGDCTGFQGSEIYRGTLAELTRDHGSAPTSLVSRPPQPLNSRLTYRFEFSLRDDNAAQGLDTGAAFTWRGVDASPSSVTPPATTVAPIPAPTPTATPTAAPVPPPVSTPTPVEIPTPTASAAPSDAPVAVVDPAPSPTAPTPISPGTTPAPTHSVTPLPPRAATPTARPTATASTGARPRDGGGRTAAVPLTGPLRTPPVAAGEASQGGALLHQIAAVAIEVGRRGAFPSVLLLLVLLYLAAQDRIDRRDPKLALAPLHADPNITFPGAGEWRTP